MAGLMLTHVCGCCRSASDHTARRKLHKTSDRQA